LNLGPAPRGAASRCGRVPNPPLLLIMREGEPPPERRSTSDEGLAHDVSRRLRRLLAEMPTPFPCRYACYIHPRRRHNEQGFGVITLRGESLPLTVTMLEGLEEVATLFEGRGPVIIGPAQDRDRVIPSDDGAWGVPLPVTRFAMRVLHAEDPEDPIPGEAVERQEVVTSGLHGPQLTLLCAHRPTGWPG